MARIYTTSTHCRECGSSFDEKPKYAKNALCRDCYNEYQRDRARCRSREQYAEFKIKERSPEYTKMRKELAGIDDRKEWLQLLNTRLTNILNKLECK